MTKFEDSEKPRLSVDYALLIRRIAAMVYDVFLLIGVLFVAGIPLALIDEVTRELVWMELIIQIYLYLVIMLYFSWFWSHGGQTPGMRAWKIRVVDERGEAIRLSRAIGRFLTATLTLLPAGLGLIVSIFREHQITWYDSLSASFLVHLPKSRN